jgi:putative redox protein
MESSYYNNKISGHLEYEILPVSPNSKMGYRHFELFVSSLLGCSTSLLANILTKKRIDYKRIDVRICKRESEEANLIEQ